MESCKVIDDWKKLHPMTQLSVAIGFVNMVLILSVLIAFGDINDFVLAAEFYVLAVQIGLVYIAQYKFKGLK